MEHFDTNSQMNSAEIKYRELMKDADDFFKIELLRQANNRYKKALNFNIETDLVKSRISDCKKMLAFERKVIFILLPIGVILILFYLLMLI